MKKTLLLALAALASMHFVKAQTKQVTVDANDALNNNTKIVAQTSIGQIFFTGHQLGTGYSYPSAGIFRAWTDQPIGSANYYYDGVTNGTINFSVRADGQGYFAGNLGIGTTVPQGKVEINNNSYTDASQLIVSGAEATRYYGVMGITVPSGHTVLSLGVRSNNTNYFETLNLVNDNVGIGTKNPDQKLSVNGTIHSKSVLIDLNGWSDYVLKNDYQLRPLSDVKNYIDQNQHLPEVPSEQEMIKKGLDVGEMNKLLIKKVEELTLYLIDEHKEKEKQEAINNKQQEQIDQLNKRIELLSNKIK
ncbi:hypothetical protein [Mucilaginibacter lappiensis]|uniref:Cell wall anchor protein n=1 Tax=Mucilaginibacter lappiensis TaxID=354630 RepID=A0A841JI15_9SPHI|nr:hypothetical protein [Mucilaginibacter lappiensis]MBB6130144.1 hypothetical protein [Mucilaginibacter lappiensis]